MSETEKDKESDEDKNLFDDVDDTLNVPNQEFNSILCDRRMVTMMLLLLR